MPKELKRKVRKRKVELWLDWQRDTVSVRLLTSSVKYKTFITPFGCYYFKILTFGIASTPENFQNRMVSEVKRTPGG